MISAGNSILRQGCLHEDVKILERKQLVPKHNLGISFCLRMSFSQCSDFLKTFHSKAVKPIALVSPTFLCLSSTQAKVCSF